MGSKIFCVLNATIAALFGIAMRIVLAVVNVSVIHGSFSPVASLSREESRKALGALPGAPQILDFSLGVFDVGIARDLSSRWNCGGAVSVVSVFALLLGGTLVFALVGKDLPLRIPGYLSPLGRGRGPRARFFVRVLGNVLILVVLLSFQALLLMCFSAVASLWSIKESCADADAYMFYLGYFGLVVYSLIALLAFFTLFTGVRPVAEGSLEREEEKEFLAALDKAGTASAYLSFRRLFRRGGGCLCCAPKFSEIGSRFARLVRLLVGVWSDNQVRAFRLLARADKHAVNGQPAPHDEVIAYLGKAYGLIWMLLPCGAVLTKISEEVNAHVVWDSARDEDLVIQSSKKVRVVRCLGAMLSLAGVVGVALAPGAGSAFVYALLGGEAARGGGGWAADIAACFAEDEDGMGPGAVDLSLAGMMAIMSGNSAGGDIIPRIVALQNTQTGAWALSDEFSRVIGFENAEEAWAAVSSGAKPRVIAAVSKSKSKSKSNDGAAIDHLPRTLWATALALAVLRAAGDSAKKGEQEEPLDDASSSPSSPRVASAIGRRFLDAVCRQHAPDRQGSTGTAGKRLFKRAGHAAVFTSRAKGKGKGRGAPPQQQQQQQQRNFAPQQNYPPQQQQGYPPQQQQGYPPQQQQGYPPQQQQGYPPQQRQGYPPQQQQGYPPQQQQGYPPQQQQGYPPQHGSMQSPPPPPYHPSPQGESAPVASQQSQQPPPPPPPPPPQ